MARMLIHVDREGRVMPSVDTLRFELGGRLRDVEDHLGKIHLSIRWEPMSRIARVGACIENYDWNTRMEVLERLVRFQQDHADDFALEFDIVPLDAVRDEEFAEAGLRGEDQGCVDDPKRWCRRVGGVVAVGV